MPVWSLHVVKKHWAMRLKKLKSAAKFVGTFAHAMQAHLHEISHAVAPGAHAALLMDRAGWHITAALKMPNNITPILLPSRAPKLNPVENVWQYLRQTQFSNRVFHDHDAIIEAGCQAWNHLIERLWRIMSISMRQSAHSGQC